MDIGHTIRKARKAKGWTLEELAHRINTDSGNLSRLERGLQGASRELLGRALQALGLSISAVSETVDGDRNVAPASVSTLKRKEYPVIDWVQAGSATDKSSSLAADAERKESTEDAGESGYWLEVMNDSMTCLGNPSFPKGSFILVRPNVEPVSGGFYVVELPEAGGKTFKQYVEDAGMRYLRSLNPDFRSITIDDSCRFIGRVVDVKMTVL